MSRIGSNPVPIPQGVTIEVAGDVLTAKGKLGTLEARHGQRYRGFGRRRQDRA